MFPGAGFGAVPYARFAHAVATHYNVTVLFLEDPQEICANHFYVPMKEPCLFPRHWVRLYEHACATAGVCRSEDIGVFSHSNGTFRAAFVCQESRLPPRTALFYEPTAVRADWLQNRINLPPGAGVLRQLAFNLVNGDEVIIKTVISIQKADCYQGTNYADEKTLLTSTPRPCVAYSMDTADDDYMMNTAQVHACVNTESIRRFRHTGDHGEFVSDQYTDISLDNVLHGFWAS